MKAQLQPPFGQLASQLLPQLQPMQPLSIELQKSILLKQEKMKSDSVYSQLLGSNLYANEQIKLELLNQMIQERQVPQLIMVPQINQFQANCPPLLGMQPHDAGMVVNSYMGMASENFQQNADQDFNIISAIKNSLRKDSVGHSNDQRKSSLTQPNQDPASAASHPVALGNDQLPEKTEASRKRKNTDIITYPPPPDNLEGAAMPQTQLLQTVTPGPSELETYLSQQQPGELGPRLPDNSAHPAKPGADSLKGPLASDEPPTSNSQARQPSTNAQGQNSNLVGQGLQSAELSSQTDRISSILSSIKNLKNQMRNKMATDTPEAQGKSFVSPLHTYPQQERLSFAQSQLGIASTGQFENQEQQPYATTEMSSDEKPSRVL